jgi:hypothetical protein
MLRLTALIFIVNHLWASWKMHDTFATLKNYLVIFPHRVRSRLHHYQSSYCQENFHPMALPAPYEKQSRMSPPNDRGKMVQGSIVKRTFSVRRNERLDAGLQTGKLDKQ